MLYTQGEYSNSTHQLEARKEEVKVNLRPETLLGS